MVTCVLRDSLSNASALAATNAPYYARIVHARCTLAPPIAHERRNVRVVVFAARSMHLYQNGLHADGLCKSADVSPPRFSNAILFYTKGIKSLVLELS